MLGILRVYARPLCKPEKIAQRFRGGSIWSCISNCFSTDRLRSITCADARIARPTLTPRANADERFQFWNRTRLDLMIGVPTVSVNALRMFKNGRRHAFTDGLTSPRPDVATALLASRRCDQRLLGTIALIGRCRRFRRQRAGREQRDARNSDRGGAPQGFKRRCASVTTVTAVQWLRRAGMHARRKRCVPAPESAQARSRS